MTSKYRNLSGSSIHYVQRKEPFFYFFLKEESSGAMNRIIKKNKGARLSDILAMEVKSYQQLTSLPTVNLFQKGLT